MKRLITLIITIVLIGAFATGCGKAQPQAPAKTTTSAQASTSSSNTNGVPNTDANGNKLTDSEKQMVANGQVIDTLVDKYIKLLYNVDAKSADVNISKLNALSVPKAGFAGINTAQLVKGLQTLPSPMALTNYQISGLNFQDTIGLADGTTYKNCVVATLVVNYTYAGKSYTDDDKLYLTDLNNVWEFFGLDSVTRK